MSEQSAQIVKEIIVEAPQERAFRVSIDATWAYDPSLVTEVEVRFTAEGPKRTRVELEHRNLERMGAGAAPTRDMMNKGWGSMLTLYASVAQG
ncbi:MAG TPA: hypothetical protein VK509_24790 [Polyangiales bacterium]|nr:hypothetical protein [Polyangiales bacterium]